MLLFLTELLNEAQRAVLALFFNVQALFVLLLEAFQELMLFSQGSKESNQNERVS